MGKPKESHTRKYIFELSKHISSIVERKLNNNQLYKRRKRRRKKNNSWNTFVLKCRIIIKVEKKSSFLLKNYRHHHHSDRNYIFYLAEMILINMRIERFDTTNIGPVVIAPLSNLKFSNLFSSLFSASMRFSAHIYAYSWKSHIFVIRIK